MLRNTPNSRADDFAKAFMDMQLAIARRAISGWVWPWFELFGSSTAPAMRVVDAFLDPILEDALEKVKSTNMSEQHNKDPVVLHDEVLNIMIAGRDTVSTMLHLRPKRLTQIKTAGMLTIAVYFLSQYPNVLRRLREEILETVGQSRRPTYDDIRNLKYLRAVLNETMRLYPAVPWNMRYAVKDTVFPNSDPTEKPLFIPAGSPVSYSVHCMHRRTDYWGPDAEEFDPDRFLDYRVHKYLTPNPFIFLPFNAGPRICLGQQFAYNEMSFFLIRLLQKFETISLETDSQPPDTRPPAHWANCPGRKGVEKFWPKAHLTLYSAGGLWLKMEAKLEE
ncbi:hypothetical protein EW026_g8044 [Hermanssonia centrifuga]|uniref:Cytochrome P450 n=1 Tax=Hermanssonia centrifuga TaxID=98765 RepID=A0A4S4K6S0_9APHY|nr:hypothetical protein EW026_g8044 [Hermanssonia centrifuga]